MANFSHNLCVCIFVCTCVCIYIMEFEVLHNLWTITRTGAYLHNAGNGVHNLTERSIVSQPQQALFIFYMYTHPHFHVHESCLGPSPSHIKHLLRCWLRAFWVHYHCCVNDHGHRAICMLKYVETLIHDRVKRRGLSDWCPEPSTLGESSFMKSDSHMKSMSCITGCKNLPPQNYPKGCMLSLVPRLISAWVRG